MCWAVCIYVISITLIAPLLLCCSPRNTNSFKVVVTVAAWNKVTFTLTYQELLVRRRGAYEHVIYVDPGQVVEDFRIEVNIQEAKELRLLRVPPIRGPLIGTTNQIGKDEYHYTHVAVFFFSKQYTCVTS